jgi:hypothetical protein
MVKSLRCGECRSCLNPKWKKRCQRGDSAPAVAFAELRLEGLPRIRHSGKAYSLLDVVAAASGKSEAAARCHLRQLLKRGGGSRAADDDDVHLADASEAERILAELSGCVGCADAVCALRRYFGGVSGEAAPVARGAEE